MDEDTLTVLDDLARTSRRSRSALVRAAVRQFAGRLIEARERDTLRKHEKRLARQAHALIATQARS